jgi:UDP-N-acetyl-D-galactosamine dehydrogenase
MKLNNITVGVVGLGYVGLPIALEFGKKIKTFGLDNNNKRIESLKNFLDYNGEVTTKEIKKSKKLFLTSNITDLSACNVFIVTVPTPLKKKNLPDLSLIINATQNIAKILKPNDIVIYESTVYPGVTEEICVPILKKISRLSYSNTNLKNFTKGFYCGYSPERINPGDKKNSLKNISKVVSGSNYKVTKFIKKIYELIIKKKIYIAPSIKVAEAAKIIENTQRDLNIALANEFLIIFEKMNINFDEVFKAASTKWNFLRFQPGLVGGHCIGVDPYYLTYKAKKTGTNPKLILAGRDINDNMSTFYAKKCLSELKKRKIYRKNFSILFLGATFKENISDCRNSKVFNLVKDFEKFGSDINIFDPHILKKDVPKDLKSYFVPYPKKNKYDCVILSVKHAFYAKKNFQNKIKSFANKNFLLFDLKYFLERKYFPKEYFCI